MEPLPPSSESSPEKCWLVRLDGARAGTRTLVRSSPFTIGRDFHNDLVPEGEAIASVSGYHCEIRRAGDKLILVDLQSTNGTFLDGKPIVEIELAHDMAFQLGPDGPRFRLLWTHNELPDPKKTLISGKVRDILEAKEREQETPKGESSRPGGEKQRQIVEQAVIKARLARLEGDGGQTVIIMGEALAQAIRHSVRRHRILIGFLALALAAVTGYAIWSIDRLQHQKSDIDSHIHKIEAQIRAASDPPQIEALIQELEGYQVQAQQIQRNLLYQLGVRDREADFIEAELRAIMQQFGAQSYSIPPEFTQRVRFHLRHFQERDRGAIERAFGEAGEAMAQIRETFAAAKMPPDLAYMVLVESSFDPLSTSSAGAAGIWQLRPATARAFGLKVDDEIDERFDVGKSTDAAIRYLRRQILDFGSGSSVMLALAAYNFGPARVRNAIRKVQDPIRQRDFWYLYRVKALPPETREYVPKIIAAIIIGRHPEKFGFKPPLTTAPSG